MVKDTGNTGRSSIRHYETPWHGTSAVFANILVKRELRWYEKLLKRFGVLSAAQQADFPQEAK